MVEEPKAQSDAEGEVGRLGLRGKLSERGKKPPSELMAEAEHWGLSSGAQPALCLPACAPSPWGCITVPLSPSASPRGMDTCHGLAGSVPSGRDSCVTGNPASRCRALQAQIGHGEPGLDTETAGGRGTGIGQGNCQPRFIPRRHRCASDRLGVGNAYLPRSRWPCCSCITPP